MSWMQKIMDKLSGSSVDKRKELAQQLSTTSGWGGYTVDYLAVALNTDSAARKAFEVLVRRARRDALDVVVVRGTLRDDNNRRHLVAGIICLNKDSRSHQSWMARNARDIDDLEGSHPWGLRDRGLDDFGMDSSELSVSEFVLIR